MTDTIFALASGAPPAGIAVIRVSGPRALAIAEQLAPPRPLSPRRLVRRRIVRPEDGELLDEGLIALFPAPASFTGEDVAEFHLHGSPAVVRALLRWLLGQEGLRSAAPGEFTRRAYAAGRLDLAQAEGLAALIAADNEEERQVALGAAQGRLSQRVASWRAQLLDLAARVEGELDFSEDSNEPIEALDEPQQRLWREIGEALRAFDTMEAARLQPEVVIVGPPNAGKSSVFNALIGREAAIVTPWAGTTRDLVEAVIDVEGARVRLVDTAGDRETDDPIEREGIDRARAAARRAALKLDLTPGAQPAADLLPVVTRIDETGLSPGVRDGRAFVSGRTGAGVDSLALELGRRLRKPAAPRPLIGNARQYAAVAQAHRHLEPEAAEALELRAERLRMASQALARVTHPIETEEVLDRIFSRLCVGK